MKKQNIKGKSISELRTLAKQAGVSAKRNWKKEDYEKALSAGSGRPASRKQLPKASTAKAKPAKKVKKTALKVRAMPEKKTKPAAKATTKKAVAKKAHVKAAKKSAVAKSLKKVSKALNAKVALKKTVPSLKSIVKNKVSNKKPAPLAKSIKPEVTLPPKKTSGLKAKNVTKHAPMFSGKAAPTVAKTGIRKVTPEKNAKILVLKEFPVIPAEYSENRVTAMPVTPKRIYVYWEITPDQVSKLKGSLNLRIVGTKKKRHVYLYLPVSERISEQFVQVSPGSKYVAEIGVITRKGRFVRAMRSKPVKTPPATGGLKSVPEKQSPSKKSAEKVLHDESFELIGSVSSY